MFFYAFLFILSVYDRKPVFCWQISHIDFEGWNVYALVILIEPKCDSNDIKEQIVISLDWNAYNINHQSDLTSSYLYILHP